MRKLNAREQVILALTVCLAVVYAGLYFVYQPIKRHEAALDQKIREQIQVLKRDLQTVEKEKHLHQFYEKLLQPFEQHSSDEEEMSQLLSQMQVLAGQSSLRIVEMKPQRTRKTEYCKFLPLSLSLEGTYVNIIRFLYLVQTEPYQLGVEELIIESKPSQSTTLSCRINVSKLLVPPKNER